MRFLRRMASTAYLTVAIRADAKIRSTVKRDSKDRYWTATLKGSYVDIGRAIPYQDAVYEVFHGRNVFTVTKAEAYAVAFAAGGNAVPMYHPRHRTRIAYYEHFHVHNHTEDAHVWFLF